ncbi:F-box associated domain, type 1 [Artemisia annua]|uniref:F-box associated domain, type 1 n=1 Tax=Artemisia annua TaxID=35608 RepID=A0A2U1PWV3_ARTAN|nr:F-box associated domain, type 1 [Artemisia annua]
MSFFNRSTEDFPENIIADILSRLPVKKIIHCKSVCKNWRMLISDSYFVNLHLSRSPANVMIRHELGDSSDFDSDSELEDWDEPGALKWLEIKGEQDDTHLHHDIIMNIDLNDVPVFQDSNVLIVGSVNGLICLWQYGPIPEYDNTSICNPITKEYVILPRQKYYRLAPASARIVYGFGIGLQTKEYKVIRTFQANIPAEFTSSRPHILEAEIYTLGTGQWRHLGHVPYWFSGSPGGFFLNGCVHWVVLDRDSPEKLCSFDFDNDTFQLFPSPPSDELVGDIRCQTSGILHGFLSLTDTSLYKFNIWVMKDYGIKKSWHKEVVIMESIIPWPTRERVYLLEALEDGTILMSFNDKLFVYCPRKKTIEGGVFSELYLTGVSYHPSFVKLQTFESERVHVGLCPKGPDSPVGCS